MMWLLHKEKCYWFSTTILSWEKSKNDCIAKKSQLAVIYDQEQKVKLIILTLRDLHRHSSLSQKEQKECFNYHHDGYL